MSSRPRAMITGIAGFAGSHLAEELLAAGYEVHGALYPGEPTENIDGFKSRLKLFRLDIKNSRAVINALGKVKPHFLCHLAAFASVGKSFEMEREVFRVNVEGTLNILTAARDIKQLKKFLYISSPDCYGIFHPSDKTLTEEQPLNPVSPYGISKAAAERMCLAHFRQYGLPVVVARAFNHTGPRQSDAFAVPSFARQIAVIEAHRKRPVISVGNLSARRDLSDVRDIVSGYRLLLERASGGEIFQLCSGRAVAIKRVLDILLSLAEIEIDVRTDTKRLRKTDIPVLRGDNDKAVKKLGYNPRYSLKRTLRDTLDYWRNKIETK